MFLQPSVRVSTSGGASAAWRRARILGAFSGLASASLALLAFPARAQFQGPEFRVNTTVADTQSTALGAARGHAVARNSTGNFVVVWQSHLQDGDGRGIFAQRFGPTGTRVGGEIAVNTTTTGDQELPAVCIDNSGNFIVVWSGNGTGDTDGVFARMYDSTGNPRGAEFRVNQTTTGVQRDADVSIIGSGDFIVVWQGNGPGDPDGIFRRLYSSGGTSRTSEGAVGADPTHPQLRPAVCGDANGDAIVVWEGQSAAGDWDIWTQRLNPAGNPQSGAARANSTTAGDQVDPAVACDANGAFVVVWESSAATPGPDDPDLYLRRFGGNGNAIGAEAPVTTATVGEQRDPAIDCDTGGNFTVAWASDDDPTAGVDWNIRVQQFSANGTRVGGVLLANETTAGAQNFPSVGLNEADDYTLVWSGNGTGDADGVFGRMLREQAITDLAIFPFVDNASPRPGDSIVLTLRVTNNGPDAATGIRVTDLLPPGLTYVSDFPTQGNYTSGTGVWDVGSLLAAGTADIGITAQVGAATAGATLVNTATITGLNQIDPVSVNNTATISVQVESEIRVALEPQLAQPLLPGGPPQDVFQLRLVNESAAAETLQAIAFTNAATGPGTPSQLDADWGPLRLEIVSPPAMLGSARFTGGRLAFTNLAARIAPGDSVTLAVRGSASVQARDGDGLDLRILGVTDMDFSGDPVVRTTWPLDPAGAFPVDGMSAAQIVVHPVGGNWVAGSTDNVGLDLTVPPNGYVADQLQKLNVVNFGTAVDSIDIAAVEAWVDDGDGRLNTTADRRLGPLAFTGNRWEITGLGEPVGLAGLRLLLSVDASPTARLGRTVRLGLESDTDVALGMQSANDGPIDQPVANPLEMSISTDDRVTLNAAALPAATVHPGARAVTLLHLVATNTYAASKQMNEIVLSNVTASPNGGSRAELDSECELLTLQADGDGNGVLDGPGVDPILATGFFAAGRATFAGFAWDLPPGRPMHLFVTADVSRDRAADGDVVGAQVGSSLDVSFADPTAVVAAWPIDSGARSTVDGMVAAQITNFGAPGISLGPGEGPALALDFVVPANGYAADALEGISLLNVGNATGPDFADLRLWRDGGDGRFTPGGGDDREIGAFVQIADTWRSTVLNEALTGAGARLFVGVTLSNAPADSATLRLSIPIGGIQTQSGNDGPLDAAISNPDPLVLSTAPLLATLSIPATESTVGQDFPVRMDVRNLSSETITGIAPSLLTPAGDAGAVLVSGPVPASFDLSPGAAAFFDWTYRGTSFGTLQLAGSTKGTGIGGLVRRSLLVQTPVHHVLLPADSLLVQPVANMPFSINRGETNVVPISLTLTNPGDPAASPVRLRALRLRIEDEQGNDIVPADILSRIALCEGAITYVSTTALPTSGAEVALTLASPLSITPNEPATISIRCDIQPATIKPVFRLAIVQSDWFTAEDVTQGTRVGVAVQQGSFPIRSGTATVRAAPTELDVQAVAGTTARAGRSQNDVALLRLQLQSPGVTGLTSNVRVGQLAFALTDTLGTPLANPGRYLRSVRIKSGAFTLDDRSVAATPDTTVVLGLALPAFVPANTNTDLVLLGDVTADAPLGSLRVRLQDPATFEARDENTNVAVPVVYAAHPLQSSPITIEALAESLDVAGTPAFPPSFPVGESGQRAVVATFRHPGTPGMGRIRITSLEVSCRDEARRALAPDRYIEALRVLRAGQEIGSASSIPASGPVSIALPDLLLEPGESASVDVGLDIEATAPATYFELLVQPVAEDANAGFPVQVVPEAGAELPLTSGLTKLASPATELQVGLTSRIPAVLVGDGSEIPLGRLALVNSANAGGGDIAIDHLVLRAGDRSRRTIAIGRDVERIVVRAGAQVWAMSDSLAPDSVTATLRPTQPLVALPGQPLHLDVFARFRAGSGAEGFRMSVDTPDIGVVQPSSAILAVRVAAASGQSFPLWTEAGSFSVASLRESFANFPNPFAAGHENTTFVYYLPAPGQVSLRIMTARGETVAWLLRDQARAAGMQQVDVWGGLNGNGMTVTNGVYLAELAVQLQDGTRDRLLRKVAVVR